MLPAQLGTQGGAQVPSAPARAPSPRERLEKCRPPQKKVQEEGKPLPTGSEAPGEHHTATGPPPARLSVPAARVNTQLSKEAVEVFPSPYDYQGGFTYRTRRQARLRSYSSHSATGRVLADTSMSCVSVYSSCAGLLTPGLGSSVLHS